MGIIKTVEEYINKEDDKLKIKWINDIYYGDKKMGGIFVKSDIIQDSD
jgi:BirA family biotin operon repressor/biotin-[acetyl-CoA-carboxylase] ligase